MKKLKLPIFTFVQRKEFTSVPWVTVNEEIECTHKYKGSIIVDVKTRFALKTGILCKLKTTKERHIDEIIFYDDNWTTDLFTDDEKKGEPITEAEKDFIGFCVKAMFKNAGYKQSDGIKDKDFGWR